MCCDFIGTTDLGRLLVQQAVLLLSQAVAASWPALVYDPWPTLRVSEGINDEKHPAEEGVWQTDVIGKIISTETNERKIEYVYISGVLMVVSYCRASASYSVLFFVHRIGAGQHRPYHV